MEAYSQYWIAGILTFFVVVGSWCFKRIVINKKQIEKKPSLLSDGLDCTKEALFNEMEATRNRPINKLPLAVDIPRLARKIIVWDEDEELMNGETIRFDNKSDLESRTYLIQSVWENVAKITNEERECYKDLGATLAGADVSGKLGIFMKENYTEDSRVIRVLKV